MVILPKSYIYRSFISTSHMTHHSFLSIENQPYPELGVGGALKAPKNADMVNC